MKGVFSTELDEIEQMIITSEYQEALKRLDKLVTRKELLEEEIIQVKILKAKIFLDIQPFSEALISARQAYEQSIKINNPLLIVDSAIVYNKSLNYLGFTMVAREVIVKAKQLLDICEDKESLEFLKRKSQIYEYKLEHSSEEYLNNLDQGIAISEQIGDDYRKAWLLFYKANELFLSTANYSKSENFYNQGLKVFAGIGNITGIMACTVNKAAKFLQSGELEGYLDSSLKALSYAEKIDSSYALGGIYGDLGFYYWQKGELDTSLEYYKKSLNQIKRGKLYGHHHYSTILFRMNLVYLEQGKFEEIQQNLEKMEIVATIRSLQDITNKKNILIYIYQLAQAIYLKGVSFENNYNNAEIILKEIVEEKIHFLEFHRLALFHLCDLYLQKLRQTNDLELLNSLKHSLNQLDELAQTQKSPILLAETSMLKSQLALIELKIEDAKQLLEKAQQIADEKRITRLATLISNEYDHILEELNNWESFTTKLPNIADRMELTHLEDMMDRLAKNRISFADVSQEEEEPSIFLIMDDKGHVIFSDNFEEIPLEPDLTEGIISTIHDFLEEKEKEKNTVNRLRFQSYNIVLYPSEDFIISYVFFGKSYSALQKFNKLIHDITTFTTIWEDLQFKIKARKELSLSDRTKISDYLESIFV